MSQYSKNRNSRLNAWHRGPIYPCYVCGNRKAQGFSQVIIEPQIASSVMFDKERNILSGRNLKNAETLRISLILCKPCTKRLAARLEIAIETGEAND